MTKQEFISISLPYGLKIISIRDKSICNLFSISKHGYQVNGKIDLKNGTQIKDSIWIDFDSKNPNNLNTELYFKPILHPLSDLTKEIEHKGEKFVPIDRLKPFVDKFNNANHVFVEVLSIHGLHYEWYYDFDNIRRSVPFIFYMKLIEWHFDIAGLIKKGEAIDINTLETNPYK